MDGCLLVRTPGGGAIALDARGGRRRRVVRLSPRLRGGGCTISKVYLQGDGYGLPATLGRTNTFAALEYRVFTEIKTVMHACEDAQGPEPHLPPQPDKMEPLSERTIWMWGSYGGSEIESAVSTGAIAFIDADWLIEQANTSELLLPRQALPPEALLTPETVQGIGMQRLVCVSHVWLQVDHPDPHGHNLRLLAEALRLMLLAQPANDRSKIGVFLDFCSMHQLCRDKSEVPQPRVYQWAGEHGKLSDGAVGRFPQEHILFKHALDKMAVLFSHPHVTVLQLRTQPQDYDLPGKYKVPENDAPYFNRGWCYFEQLLAFMLKTHRNVVDVTDHIVGDSTQSWNKVVNTCGLRPHPPIAPHVFAEELQHKCFTDAEADRPLLNRLYREAVTMRFAGAKKLAFQGLGWGDIEACAFAELLASEMMPKVEVLLLQANVIGDEGGRAIAKALHNLPALTHLELAGNNLTDEVKSVFREKWVGVVLNKLR